MEQEQISNTTLGLMVGTALFYDVFQALLNIIPVVGWILASVISLFALLTFGLWFKFYDRSFVRPSRAMAMGAGIVIEIIPILNALPGWTVAVIFLVGLERIEWIKQKFFKEGGFVTKTLKGVAKITPQGRVASLATRPKRAR